MTRAPTVDRRPPARAVPPAGAPVRVLHLVKGLDAGGAETLLVLAARHRDRERFRYEIAHLLPHHVALRDAVHEEGVATSCLRGVPWWDPRWLGRLRRRLVADPVDIVHAHSPLVAAGARLVVRSLRRADRPRVVVTLHNMWASHHPAVRAVDRLTSPLDDARLTVSEAVRRSLPGPAAEAATTLVHGIDVDALRGRADREAARRELGVGPDQLLVGTVANLRAAKAYPDLIDAAVVVTAARPEVRFVAVGQGPLHEELEARRDAAGLGDRLRFVGYRADAARLVSGFDVFCLSSHHEGLPLALMEALVLGVPVVVTDVGGVGELVRDGVEGRLVPPARPDLLAAALVALAADPAIRAGHAAAARSAGEHLDAATAVAAIEARYLRVIAG